MSAKHTPGPWLYSGPLGMGHWITAQNSPAQVAAVYGDGPAGGIEGCGLANAYLVAAAPEMLAALEAAESILWMAERYADAGGSHSIEMEGYTEAATEIRAAIAKARGEA